MTFSSLIGQSRAVAMLERLLATGRVPQALLFQGPDGVGKATAASALARTLLCTAGSGAPCGRCDSCRLPAGSGHPDLWRVGLLPRDPGEEDEASQPRRGSILVEQIREVSHLASLTPRLAARRLFLVDPADRMNLEAQNALLKTLEEPPGASVLILIASRPHALLPTVRSRCFAVGFSPISVADLARWLEERGLGVQEAARRAALADGRVGRALTLELDTVERRREEVLAALELLAAGKPEAVAALPRLAADLAGKEEATLQEGLDLVEELLRDVARAGLGAGAAELTHPDLASRLARLAGSLPPARAAGLVAAVERLRTSLRVNVNRTLLAESLLAAVAGAPLP